MKDPEMIGAIVLGLAAIVGLFATIGNPIMKAVKVMTELNASIQEVRSDISGLKTNVDESVKHARDGRKRLWEAHDKLKEETFETLDDHERRIGILEISSNIPNNKD